MPLAMSVLGVFQPLCSCTGAPVLFRVEMSAPHQLMQCHKTWWELGEILCVRRALARVLLSARWNSMAAVFSTVFKGKGHHMKSPPPPEVKKVHGGEPKQLRFSQFPTCVAAGQEMVFFSWDSSSCHILDAKNALLVQDGFSKISSTSGSKMHA